MVVMVEHTDEQTGTSSRRRFILAGGAVGIAGLAGCSGGSGGGDDGGDGAGAGLESGGDDGGDGGSGGGDDEAGDEMLSDSFDPESPDWENNNYLAAPLIDATYQRGTQLDLEQMNDREVDEVPHGNPVQERPDDESEWLDPDTLVFTESPAEDRQQSYVEALDPLIERLEETTGKDVEFTQVQSYAASVEAMRSERVHIANFATGATPFAVNLAGAVPFAVGFQGDGAFGYRLFATTRADNHEIQSVEDFANDGVRIAHAEPSSNSGHQAPSALFDQEFGVTPEEDYEVNFSGGHSQTTRGIANDDYDAGPICSTCMKDTVDADNGLSYDDFKVVWASNPFPPGPVAYRYNLHPDIVEGIEEAWLDTSWEGTTYEEATDYAEFVPIEYRKHWYDIMVIQRYNGVDYESGNL
jgi:phosphonate transport system substrate-binding protein